MVRRHPQPSADGWLEVCYLHHLFGDLFVF
jgi:hypothetical protein